jgi:hypothetical protein
MWGSAVNQGRLLRLLWLSIAAAVATISLKTVAWLEGAIAELSAIPSTGDVPRVRRA